MAGKCSHCAFPIELSPMHAGWPVVEVTMRRQMAGVWMAAPCWWCETHPAPGAPWREQELQGLWGRLGQPVLRTSEGCVSDIAEGSDMQMYNQGGIFVSIPPLLWLQLLWLHQGGLSPSAATSLLQLMCSWDAASRPFPAGVQVSSLLTREPGARNSSWNRSGVGVCNRHSTLAFRGVVLTSSPGTAYSSHVKCLMRIWVGSHFPPSYKTN